MPGGNDTLLLSALPSLAMHAAVAYLAMLGVQTCLSILAKRWKDRQLRYGMLLCQTSMLQSSNSFSAI